jgi:5S rRNA maturation endonuclease (ribonuclease M5)
MSAFTDVLDKLDGAKRSGENYMARCPAPTHGGEDRNPSLSVKEGENGRVLFKCFAGCEFDDIAAGLGLTARDLAGDQPQEVSRAEWTPHGDAVAVYDYRDEQGNLLFQVLRTADKQFPQRTPDPTRKSGWSWKLGDTRRVLYRLPKVLEAVAAGNMVWIVEGEKDVHSLERVGQIATCNPGGAGKWRPEFSAVLEGADVTVCADKDKPGQAHARMVAAALQGVARTVRVVEAADPHKDISDHIAAGCGFGDLQVVTADSADSKPVLAPGINEFLDGEDEPYQWIVPGLLERGDRLILTGFEGLGKSMLGRQLAVCLAAGIHPFKHTYVAPARVLLIDCENSRQQTRRKLRPIRDQAIAEGRPVENDNLRIILRTEGLDLTTYDDASWLLERVQAHQPDVLFIGPLYRLHFGDPKEEMPARKLIAAIDAARAVTSCAVVIEAHSGHGTQGERSVRPFGASIYLRWPEFGYGLRPRSDTVNGNPVEFKSWRGPRDERDWPEHLAWGGMGGWPWVPCGPPGKQVRSPWAGNDGWQEATA